MELDTIVSLVTGMGFGGIVGVYFQFLFQRKQSLQDDIHQVKRARYGAIIIQMLTILSPEHLPKTQKFRPDLKDIQDFKEEVKVEILHGILFACDEVIKAMTEFVQEPSYSSYFKTVVAMRKDLWGRKAKIEEDDLTVFSL